MLHLILSWVSAIGLEFKTSYVNTAHGTLSKQSRMLPVFFGEKASPTAALSGDLADSRTCAFARQKTTLLPTPAPQKPLQWTSFLSPDMMCEVSLAPGFKLSSSAGVGSRTIRVQERRKLKFLITRTLSGKEFDT
eukprot:2170906-Rhodomonas_salina.2